MKRFTITFAVAVLTGLINSRSVPVPPIEELTITTLDTSVPLVEPMVIEMVKPLNQTVPEKIVEKVVPKTTQYEGTEEYVKRSPRLQDKMKRQVRNWKSNQESYSYGEYDSYYSSGYPTKQEVSNTAEVEAEEEEGLESSQSLYNWIQHAQLGMDEDAAENEYYQQDKALKQILKLTEKALKDKYTTDSAAIAANVAINATEQAAQVAALKLAHDQELATLKANIAQQREDAKFQMKLKSEEFNYLQREVELTEGQKISTAFVSSLPLATQELLKAEQQKEKDVLKRKRFDNKNKLYLKKYQTSTVDQTAEYTQFLNQSATEAGCNATCVTDCAATQTGYANQSTCLDVCTCFYDSLIRVPPTPVVTVPKPLISLPLGPVTVVQIPLELNSTTPTILEVVKEVVATEVANTTTTTTTTTTSNETTTSQDTVAHEVEFVPKKQIQPPLVRPQLIGLARPILNATAPLVIEANLTEVVAEPVVEIAVSANATTSLFGSIQNKGETNVMYLAILVLVFFALVMSALYASKNVKKGTTEQQDSLTDYLLLKA